MAVDWNADGMLMWREEVVKEQQECFDLLGKPMWREFEPSQYCNLKREIGFALFGVPEEEPCANLNDGTGYTDKKLKEINKIFDIIKKCMQNHNNPKNICVAFLFVFGKTRDACITVPVIRMPQFDNFFNDNLFIDSCGRVYKGWQDYLKNNTIAECVLCYPRNGVYSAVNGAVEVEFGISPAGQTGAKVLQGLDIGGTVLSVGATGALIAGLFAPVALPVIAGAAGVSMLSGFYAAGRSIQTLVDRDQHQQSIGLDSAESRNCWLGIAGGVMGFVSGGNMAAAARTTRVAARTARAAATVPLAGQIAMKSVAFSSCVLNGLAVSNGLANIIDKALNEKEITALDVFQLTSAVLFFTNSVISTRQAKSLINSRGKNSSQGSSGDKRALRNRISEFVEPTKACNSVAGVLVGCLPKGSGLLLSVCSVVGRKLIEITKSLLRGLTSMCNYVLGVGELLCKFWESWNKEITEIIDMICRAFGVKHWSELVNKGCRFIESGLIKALATTLIAEKRSLLIECGSAAMPSHQRQDISDNRAVVGTDGGSNSLVDGETQTYESYYGEIANIHAKFVDRQMCRNPADFCRYMTFICKFVRGNFQKKKSCYEKMWDMEKDFVNVEEFNKKYGISGNPNNHFLQEVFNEFKKEEQDVFTLLCLAYESQNAGSSAQEEENGQGFLDVDGVHFHPFYSMRGLASSGMLSEKQYRELAAKFMGQHADTDSIYMSDSGDTAVIQVNDAADVIMVRCWPEDGKVSGIAAVLHTASE